jgi:hypothetical protein
MAINPADMSQCDKKCRCFTGDNQGQAYNCKQPCYPGEVFVAEKCDCYPEGDLCLNGVKGVLTSTIQTATSIREATTFFPQLMGGSANGAGRVIDGVLSVFDGASFIEAALSPFAVGQDDNGEEIVDVLDKLTLQECATGFDYVWISDNTASNLLNSVDAPPQMIGTGPTSTGENLTSSNPPPHAFAYYDTRTFRCNGQVFDTPIIVRGPLGTIPPFPEWTVLTLSSECS